MPAVLGVTASELIYRLAHDGWPAVVPFQDAQRAMRIVCTSGQPRSAIDAETNGFL